MLIAARNAMMAASGWRNPYVTNGLVAMWDGEWNVGGGRSHDNSSTVWLDCVGGRPILLTSDNTYFSSAGLVQTQGVNAQWQYCIYGNMPGSSTSYDWSFLQIIFTNATLGQDSNFVFDIGKRLVAFTTSISTINVTAYSNPGWIGNSVSFQTNVATSISVDYSSAGLNETGTKVWFNENELSHTGRTDTWSNSSSVPYLGTNMYSATNNYRWYGTYHAIRLYNRTLTAEELATNYAVDKARFNLP